MVAASLSTGNKSLIDWALRECGAGRGFRVVSGPDDSCWRVEVNRARLCASIPVKVPSLNRSKFRPEMVELLLRRPLGGLRRWARGVGVRSGVMAGVALMLAGLGSVVDAGTGEPVRGVRVGRTLYTWKGPGGEFLKGGEELLLQQTYTRTDADGRFELPSRRAALLLRFGDYSMNMRLVLQRQGYVAWRTNFPMAALGTNQPGPEPRIETGAIRMQRR